MLISALERLPVELLAYYIAPILDVEALKALRLTSKLIEAALFNPFVRKCFAKRLFIFTTRNLYSLVQISQQPRFSESIRHIIVDVEQLCDGYRHFQYLNRDFDDSDHIWWMKDPEDYEDWERDGFLDRNQIELCAVMMIKIFTNLTNLRTLTIQEHPIQGHNTMRDGADLEHIHGSPTALETFDVKRFCNPYDALNRSTAELALRMLLDTVYRGFAIRRARADSKKCRYSVMPEVQFLFHQHAQGLPDQVLWSLLSMHGDLRGLRSLVFESEDWKYPHGNNYSLISRQIKGALSKLARLTYLRLYIRANHHHAVEQLLYWMNHSKKRVVPRLERLDLGYLIVPKDHVLGMIERLAPTLRSLSFWKLTLHGGNLDKYPECPSIWLECPNVWRILLRQMLRIDLLQLRELNFHGVAQTFDGTLDNTMIIKFLPQGNDGRREPGINDRVRSYICIDFDSLSDSRKGEGDMRTFLPQFIQDMRVCDDPPDEYEFQSATTPESYTSSEEYPEEELEEEPSDGEAGTVREHFDGEIETEYVDGEAREGTQQDSPPATQDSVHTDTPLMFDSPPPPPPPPMVISSSSEPSSSDSDTDPIGSGMLENRLA